MDPQIPVPTTQSSATPPPQTSKLPLLLGVVLLLGIASVGSYILGTKSSTNIIKAPIEKTYVTVASSSPTPTSESNETDGWKKYEGETLYTSDGSSLFSVKYPPEWQLEGKVLYPEGKSNDQGVDPQIYLGAGGHGVPEPTDTLSLPAGEATYWRIENGTLSLIASISKNNIAYILEGDNLTTEHEKTFLKMLNTLVIYPQDSNKTASWKTYQNTKYNFEFKYPQNWSLKVKKDEGSSNFVVFQSPNGYGLGISFKQKEDTAQLGPSGIAAGDFVKKENINFGSTPLSKDVLVYQGKNKEIWYNKVSTFTIGNVTFLVSLYNVVSTDSDYNNTSLDNETEQTADKILSTFKFTQ